MEFIPKFTNTLYIVEITLIIIIVVHLMNQDLAKVHVSFFVNPRLVNCSLSLLQPSDPSVVKHIAKPECRKLEVFKSLYGV
jgi:hypothetical protein